MNTNDKEALFQVWDVETTMEDRNPDRSASNPFYKDNRIVMLGVGVMMEDETFISGTIPVADISCKTQPDARGDMIVGHNIKFDLHYMRPYMGVVGLKETMDKCAIWDTQIAAYVLSGQRDKMTSLDDLCRLYSLDTKKGAGHEEITEMFKNGLGAQHADQEKLAEYLKHDLEQTGRVALIQMRIASDAQFNLIAQMGDALKAVCEMEYNGMHVNLELIRTYHIEIVNRMLDLQQTMEKEFHLIHPDAEELLLYKPNALTSNQVLSCILFGGQINYTAKTSVGIYKSGAKKGQVKFRNLEKTITFKRQRNPEGITEATKVHTKHGDIVYKVDENVFEKLPTHVLPIQIHALFKALLEMKKYAKVSGTYYDNFESMADEDSIIHHTLHQTTTNTGRLSSAKPNMQNVPMSGDNPLLNVKSVLDSRYEDGVIVEIDFKQLEICALAWLTKDPQLIHDIRSGKDIHEEIGKQLGIKTEHKKTRRDVKAIVFAIIYGAGANGISKSTGLDKDFVRKVMDAFYDRYSTIQDFYKDMTHDVETGGPRFDLITRGEKGPEHMFEWTSPTGRTYLFNQDPFRPGPKYTQLRNYPVQGTATADIVPIVIAEVYRVLRNVPKTHRVKLITTTHDSITLDCGNIDDAKHVVRVLNYEVFLRIENLINDKFPDIKWDIPLTIECEIGKNWGTMEKMEVDLYK